MVSSLKLILLFAVVLGVLSETVSQDVLELGDQQMADKIAETVSTTEWLGPLAPIAISPFFGITCLAGMSQFGQGTFLESNNLISDNPVLSSPVVFWVFLVLTLLTSLPRLTKVSKPIAQALDQLETYSGIITLLVIKVVGGSIEPEVASAAAVVHFGPIALGADVLLGIAAVINIVVINTIKFFFEVLIWITPIPFVDAIFEMGKQATCAGLLAIYAFSPLLATLLNLLMFVACLWVYRWVHRRVVYARYVLFDPLFASLSRKYGKVKRPQLVVFAKGEFGPFPAKARIKFSRMDDGWQLKQLKMFGLGLPCELKLSDSSYAIEMERGLLVNSLKIDGDVSGELLFTRRYASDLESLASVLQVKPPNGQVDRVEFSLNSA